MRRLRWRELLVILVLVVAAGLIVLPMFTRARESARRASCQNNLKQLGLVLKMYANETKGEKFPPLSRRPGDWMLDIPAVYPEYLSDLNILVCPAHPYAGTAPFALKHTWDHPASAPRELNPDCAWGRFYTYTGHAIISDEQAAALYAAAHQQGWNAVRDQDLELDVPVWEGSNRAKSVGQNGIPVLWDRVPLDPEMLPHANAMINVLHMDGHVEAVPYAHDNGSNNFPVTYIAAQTFGRDVPQLPRDCY